ncbi:hypothetical protein A2871_02330 [Candidatus Daviesbacteria bacterium RIFCSPHIGHO2_01_FULL_41_23]|uniref:NIF system FeS cluster assembly NifU N-terminal domain-containing protein n=1 Tax=Candidatus Daviesbacteria bacterium RIFCSPHIGHO2_01_FULL_41_23 TaxID=1797764 RepID=A0A1F5ITW2_9BACT|nr:MAG: hypothetical protein A2871_02330 [Candidatus Daviesbacteria bacterium RIFCSPHIGHO2_01_FULL_41_23]
MDLTQEIILQHGRSSPFKKKLKNPTLSAELDNPMCGDTVIIELEIVKGRLVDASFSGEGCLISQASASLLVGEVKRIKKLSEIKKFNQDLVLKLLGIPLTLSRVQCAVLSLEVLKKVIKEKV